MEGCKGNNKNERKRRAKNTEIGKRKKETRKGRMTGKKGREK
jgi:hypothetical protein